MKLVFAGTPEFARVALQHLLAAGFSVPLVLTQPDRPAGRGMKLQSSPVKQCALEHGIAIAQPSRVCASSNPASNSANGNSAINAGDCSDVSVMQAFLIQPPPGAVAGASLAR